MAIERWSPFQEMTSLREAMNRLMEEAFVSPRRILAEQGGMLATDIYEEGDNFCIEANMPGVRPEDVEITVTGSTVTVKAQVPCPERRRQEGEQQAEAGAQTGRTYLVHERPCGVFRRTITLPSMIDAGKAQATFQNGVLCLVVPKSEAARPRRIQVTAGAGAPAQAQQQVQVSEGGQG